MPKIDVLVCYKDTEEDPEDFENMDSFDIVKGGKFLYLATDIDIEYYVPLANVMWWQVCYKGEENV